MKRVFASWTLAAVLAGFCLAAFPSPGVAAQPAPTATPAPAPATDSNRAELVGFGRLGIGDRVLRGPFDTAQILFALPADWKLSDAPRLRLNINVLNETRSAQGTTQGSASAGGTLEITLNGAVQQTVVLEQSGEQALNVALDPAMLLPPAGDSRNDLRITLDAPGVYCEIDADRRTLVTLRASSFFIFPHTQVAPSVSLAGLPKPIFQNSFVPDSATIVVPTQPSAAELQAAFAAAAGFGQQTNSRLAVGVTPIDQLSEAQRKSDHLILVGKPAGLPLLNELKLPAPATNAGFGIAGQSPDDGVIQMATSPWNPTRVVLLISGNSDAAVAKAGQAVSTGAVRAGSRPDLALVAATQPASPSSLPVVDRSFADLGYGLRMLENTAATADYRFSLPADRSLAADSYIDMVFSHSGLVDYDLSEVIVSLNGAPLGGIRLSDATTRVSTTRFTVPASAARPGTNLLSVRSKLAPRSSCAAGRTGNLWVSVWPESALHLPLGPASNAPTSRADLASYPAPFTLTPSLAATAFVVPADDPLAWDVAARLAYNLGDRADASMANLAVAFADALPDELKQQRDLILVGKPSALPLLRELGDTQPLAFEAGSDLATERNVAISYRSAPDTSLGYVQLVQAPWNAQRSVLAVLGSTPEGLRWASNALLDPRLRGQLSGALAVVSGEQITSSERALQPAAQPAPAAGAVPAATAATTGAPAIPAVAAPAPVSDTSLLVPLILSIVGVMIVAGGIFAFRTMRKRP